MVANLAGPESSLKLDSREIKCMLYWVPPLDHVAITISFLTYADQVRMAVISDRAVLPNPELLTRDFIYKLETMSKLLAHRRIPGEQLSSRMESMHMLSSYTLDDLTSEQLQMALVQQELHDMKLQLEAGSSHRLTANDTQLCQRIEQLKERSRELLMYLRKRRAAEAENAVILSEEDELMDSDSDRQRPFRRRTLSMSSKMSTASVSSTMRPLSTASLSNQPSPSHAFPPPWPDFGAQDGDRFGMLPSEGSVGGASGPGSKKHGYNYRQRLSTMEEFEMDESLIVSSADARKCNTY
nr:hypothetical protein BaRGS_009302 [Batillaria attramentaria]